MPRCRVHFGRTAAAHLDMVAAGGGHIMAKLEAANRTQVVILVRDAGLS